MENNKQKKVTISTVANYAAVSIKTVSRVLNKETPMRESTRERVLKVIDELGYKPNLAAVALAGRQSKIIGLAYSNSSASYLMSIQTGVLNACKDKDYNLVIYPCDVNNKSVTNDLVNFAKNSSLDGLILVPPLCDKKELTEVLTENGIDVVSISPAIQKEHIMSVHCDDKNAVDSMVAMLIEAGHQRIGFIKGHLEHGATIQRYLGYKKALQNAGIKLDNDLVKQGDFSFESGKACANDLLKLTNKPSAIIASNDYMAAGVISSANRLGLNVPDDLSVIGYDDAPVSRQITPFLSTIKQPIEDMAEAVTNMLIAKSKGDTVEVKNLEFKAELLIRESHKKNAS